ncbi:hypothetical protein BT96DRAFT_838472 [Gymnopus androsaceus JB14]|uniref:hAT-like transposase RNase-H fold domain-containing protein n=1 Tax=Gymnopus androsaceus JB14 TaxID=1447944 RepID=A0A6A4GNT8_9AGAR|nr:hypothetical protein BT96DRAFT_838472 [Gymnopus androsaceus JB14]
MKTVIVQFLDCASNGLADYTLLEEEWEAANDLTKALKILKDATAFFSSNTPNISAVIQAMDAINKAFASGIVKNHQLCAPLHHAFSIGKKTLNKYYALTNNSNIYCIAMVLHPSFKTNYFSHLNWPEDGINDAVEVTHNAWTSRYKPSASTPDTTASSPPIVCSNF